MRLLLDQNLSHRLLLRSARRFPGSRHVRDFGWTGDDDERVWRAAAAEGFVLVPKDSDFLHRGLLRGYPPKAICIRTGNCGTAQVARLLVARVEQIEAFAAEPTASVFCL